MSISDSIKRTTEQYYKKLQQEETKKQQEASKQAANDAEQRSLGIAPPPQQPQPQYEIDPTTGTIIPVTPAQQEPVAPTAEQQAVQPASNAEITLNPWDYSAEMTEAPPVHSGIKTIVENTQQGQFSDPKNPITSIVTGLINSAANTMKNVPTGYTNDFGITNQPSVEDQASYDAIQNSINQARVSEATSLDPTGIAASYYTMPERVKEALSLEQQAANQASQDAYTRFINQKETSDFGTTGLKPWELSPELTERPTMPEGTSGNLQSDFAAGIGGLIKGVGQGIDFATDGSYGKDMAKFGGGTAEIASNPTKYGLNVGAMAGQEGEASAIAQALPLTLALMPIGVGGGALAASGARAVGLGTTGQAIAGLTGASLSSRFVESLVEAGSFIDEAKAAYIERSPLIQKNKEFEAKQKSFTEKYKALQESIKNGYKPTKVEVDAINAEIKALNAEATALKAEYDTLIKEADKYARTQAGTVFAKNMGLVGLDAVQFAATFGRPYLRQLKATKNFDKLPKSAQVAGTMLLEAGTEGGEEVAQSNFGREAMGKETDWNPFSKENIDEFTIGAAMGTIFGGVGLVTDKMNSSNTLAYKDTAYANMVDISRRGDELAKSIYDKAISEGKTEDQAKEEVSKNKDIIALKKEYDNENRKFAEAVSIQNEGKTPQQIVNESTETLVDLERKIAGRYNPIARSIDTTNKTQEQVNEEIRQAVLNDKELVSLLQQRSSERQRRTAAFEEIRKASEPQIQQTSNPQTTNVNQPSTPEQAQQPATQQPVEQQPATQQPADQQPATQPPQTTAQPPAAQTGQAAQPQQGQQTGNNALVMNSIAKGNTTIDKLMRDTGLSQADLFIELGNMEKNGQVTVANNNGVITVTPVTQQQPPQSKTATSRNIGRTGDVAGSNAIGRKAPRLINKDDAVDDTTPVTPKIQEYKGIKVGQSLDTGDNRYGNVTVISINQDDDTFIGQTADGRKFEFDLTAYTSDTTTTTSPTPPATTTSTTPNTQTQQSDFVKDSNVLNSYRDHSSYKGAERRGNHKAKYPGMIRIGESRPMTRRKNPNTPPLLKERDDANYFANPTKEPETYEVVPRPAFYYEETAHNVGGGKELFDIPDLDTVEYVDITGQTRKEIADETYTDLYVVEPAIVKRTDQGFEIVKRGLMSVKGNKNIKPTTTEKDTKKDTVNKDKIASWTDEELIRREKFLVENDNGDYALLNAVQSEMAKRAKEAIKVGDTITWTENGKQRTGRVKGTYQNNVDIQITDKDSAAIDWALLFRYGVKVTDTTNKRNLLIDITMDQSLETSIYIESLNSEQEKKYAEDYLDWVLFDQTQEKLDNIKTNGLSVDRQNKIKKDINEIVGYDGNTPTTIPATQKYNIGFRFLSNQGKVRQVIGLRENGEYLVKDVDKLSEEFSSPYSYADIISEKDIDWDLDRKEKYIDSINKENERQYKEQLKEWEKAAREYLGDFISKLRKSDQTRVNNVLNGETISYTVNGYGSERRTGTKKQYIETIAPNIVKESVIEKNQGKFSKKEYRLYFNDREFAEVSKAEFDYYNYIKTNGVPVYDVPKPQRPPVLTEKDIFATEQTDTTNNTNPYSNKVTSQQNTFPAIPDAFNSRKQLYDWAVNNGITTFKERNNGKGITLYRGSNFISYREDNGKYIIFDRAWEKTTNPDLGRNLSEFIVDLYQGNEYSVATGKISNWVRDKLVSGTAFTYQELFSEADNAFDGTQAEGKYTPKDAYDAMELGINKYISETSLIDPSVKTAEEAIRIVNEITNRILANIPTQSKRTAEQNEFQQFSTPPNIAYVASWIGNIVPTDVVLEPSAGIGGLAVFANKVANTVVVNELSERRLDIIKQMGFDQAFNENAEYINAVLPANVKPTVVIMNPPFSSTAGRMQGSRDTTNAKKHIQQALDRLEPGGRLIAIVGKGMAEDSATFRDWWKQLKQTYNIRANVRIDGKNYAKYGTQFDIQLIVIDKTGPTTDSTLTNEYTDLGKVITDLEGIRNARNTNRANEQPTNQQGGTEGTTADGDKNQGGYSAPVSTGTQGDNQGAVSRQDANGGTQTGTGDANVGEGSVAGTGTGMGSGGTATTGTGATGQDRPATGGGDGGGGGTDNTAGQGGDGLGLSGNSIASTLGQINNKLGRGAKKPKSQPKGENNTTNRQERKAEIDKDIVDLANQFSSILNNNLSVNPIFNPELVEVGLKIGFKYLQKGYTSFGEWKEKIISDFKQIAEKIANEIEPFLDAIFDAVSSFPKNKQRDEEVMRLFIDAAGGLYKQGITEKNDIRKELIKYVDEDIVNDYIDSVHAALDKWPGLGKNSADKKTIEGIQNNEVAANKEEITDDIYEVYQPQIKVAGSKPHPAELVESAAMRDVRFPQAEYVLQIPQKAVDSGAISDAQIEAATYAAQSMNQVLPDGNRRGFLIGDGTGVGKTREIIAVISDALSRGYGNGKVIVFSADSALEGDLRKNMESVGIDPNLVFTLSKKADEPIKRTKGVLFTTYKTLSSSSSLYEQGNGYGFRRTNPDKKSRVEHILTWIPEDFDGVIVFDEAHKMGNSISVKKTRGKSKPSLQALVGIGVQNARPNARVLYASATAATEVNNLGYATRLGLWGRGTPFTDARQFIERIGSAGLAAMETVCRDMKSLGAYIARSISFRGVKYRNLEHNLTEDQLKTYDLLCDAWQSVFENFNAAMEQTGMNSGPGASNEKGQIMSQFWNSNQRFWNQVLTALQMPSVMEDIRKQVDDGKSVVVQLTGTNEAATERAVASREEGQSLEEIDITPRQIIIDLVEKFYPTAMWEEYLDDNDNLRIRPVTRPTDKVEFVHTDEKGKRHKLVGKVIDGTQKPDGTVSIKATVKKRGKEVEEIYEAKSNMLLPYEEVVNDPEALRMKQRLIARLASDEFSIPDSPLDNILNVFGIDNVAEVTGRTYRLVYKTDENGQRVRIREPWGKEKGIVDADSFQEGKKRILVFSDAGGTGRSYHADKNSGNKQQRVHYLVQPGWRADNAIQGLGRSHRSNQVSTPEFVLVTTNIKGHKRFISTIARRLDQLGALTKGQRQTGRSGLFSEKDNLENVYAKDAVTRLFVDLFGNAIPSLNFRQVAEGMGLYSRLYDEETNQLNSDYIPDVPQFLNRLLSLRVDLQNEVFDEFVSRMERLVDEAVAAGKLDTGLEVFRADSIKKENEQVVYTDNVSNSSTTYVQFETKRKNEKLTYNRLPTSSFNFLGIYRNTRSGQVWAVQRYGTETDENGRVVTKIRLQGQTIDGYRIVNEDEFRSGNYAVVNDEQRKAVWDEEVNKVQEFRTDQLHLLSGTLLPIWDRIPQGVRIRVVKLQDNDGNRHIGVIIPPAHINTMLRNLGATPNAVRLSPIEIVDRIVRDNYVVTLSNNWRMERRIVSGQQRIELIGPSYREFENELRGDGVFDEVIQYRARFFIPTGQQGVNVMENITRYRQVVEAVPMGTQTGGSGRLSFGFDPTFGKFDDTDIQSALKPYVNKAREAIPKLFQLGQYVVDKGIVTGKEWMAEMRNKLGNLWDNFRPVIGDVWSKVKDYINQIAEYINNERGSIPVDFGVGGKEPKNVKEAYKLFEVDKNGNLTPKYVNREPLPIGQWIDAQFGPVLENGSIKAHKLGSVAPRPGFHSASLPVATHIGQVVNGQKYRRSNEVWAKILVPNDVNWQEEANRRGTNKKGEIVPSKAEIRDQLPVGGFYHYKTNKEMFEDWLISGSMKIVKILTDEEVREINDKAGVADLPRLPGDNGPKVNAPNKLPGVTLSESETVYDTAVKNFPEIEDDEVASRALMDGIQQTIDFGKNNGDIIDEVNKEIRADGTPKRKSTQIGLGITRKLVNEGVVSLVGHKINSTQELAEIAQVLRHPGYEKFHRVYVDANGNIVHHETVTSMLPSETATIAKKEKSFSNMLTEMDDNIVRLGATKLYYIHNHPSTNPTPSGADITLTKNLAEVKYADGRPGLPSLIFAGHIVLDTDQYSLIEADGSWKTENISKNYQINYTQNTDIPHMLLGSKLYTRKQLASAMKQVVDTSRTTAFFVTSNNEIRGITQLPEEINTFSSEMINRYLRLLARKNYASRVVVVTSNTKTFGKMKQLVGDGRVDDVLLTTDNRSAANEVVVNKDNTWFGIKKEQPGMRLLEDQAQAPSLATDNTGTFDGTNPDIRYNVKNPNQEVVDALIGSGSLNPVTRTNLRKAFPGATIRSVGEMDMYEVTMPNGQKLVISRVDEINLSPDEITQMEKDYSLIYPDGVPSDAVSDGVFYPNDALTGFIDLARIATTETLHHEAFHAAMFMALTKREQQAVLSRYGTGNEPARTREENAAKAYAAWRDSYDGKSKPKSMIERIWKKIYDFAMAIRDTFIVDEAAVFRAIASGKVWKRKSNLRNSEGAAYNATPTYSVAGGGSRKAVASTGNEVTIKPVTRNGQRTYTKESQKIINALTKRGWNRTDNTDGSIVFQRPAQQQAQQNQQTNQQQAQQPAQQTQQPAQTGAVIFSDPETERQWQSSKTPENRPLKERLSEAIGNIYAVFTREFKYLPRTKQFAELRNYLLKLQHQKGVANDTTVRWLNGITKTLKDRGDYDLFSRKVIMDDLAEELKATEDYDLPFGWTKDSFDADKALVDAAVDANDNVKQALAARKAIWQEINKKYVDSMKAIGFNVADRISKENYFHHIVLEYAATREELRLPAIAGQRKLATPTARGFLKQRKGSTKNIMSDYLQPEFEVLAQMLYDVEIAKTIKMVDDKYNIVDKLKKAALKENDRKMFEVLLDQTGNAVEAITTYNRLGWKQALAIQRLEKLASEGELPLGPGDRFSELMDALTQSYINRQQARELDEDNPSAGNGAMLNDQGMKDLFAYVNWLLKEEQADEAGRMEAALFFKGIAEKKKAIKDALGKDFTTWRDLIPEGYDTWQPREGNMFYTSFTIPEKIAEAIQQNALKELGISPDKVRKALVMGGRRSEFVLPVEVINTLDEMQTQTSVHMLTKVGSMFVKPWKIWVLTSPTRLIKYNIGNMAGDADGTLAGNPKAFRKVKRASAELYQLFYGNGEMTEDLKGWFERGGMQTLLQVQELGEIGQLKFFDRFKDNETTVDKIIGIPKRIFSGYWNQARKGTDFREAILRYANYLEYLEQMNKNNGKPDNFGASNREEIMGIEDIQDRAFKLSNELLGAYDSISVVGKELRAGLIPFWSWNEVNARRYVMLMKNAVIDGNVAELVGRRVLGAVALKAPAMAISIGSMVIKASMMWALLQAFNIWMFPDEEDELPEEVRGKPHIIWGRDADGKIRYTDRLGAFSDFLDWFGLAGFPTIVRDLMLGRKTPKEIANEMWKDPINKIVNGITPTLKTPAELMFNKRIFPDVFKARPINDKTQYLFDSFGLGNEFKAFSRTQTGQSMGIDPRPARPYLQQGIPAFVSKSADPGQTAFFSIAEDKRKFQEKLGKLSDGESNSEKSIALRMYKQSLRYEDIETAAYYLARYKALGGKKNDMIRSLKTMEPLYGLNKEEKQQFINGLTSEQKRTLARAQAYYKTTIDESGFEVEKQAKELDPFKQFMKEFKDNSTFPKSKDIFGDDKKKDKNKDW